MLSEFHQDESYVNSTKNGVKRGEFNLKSLHKYKCPSHDMMNHIWPLDLTINKGNNAKPRKFSA
jgi:hypothetical protein